MRGDDQSERSRLCKEKSWTKRTYDHGGLLARLLAHRWDWDWDWNCIFALKMKEKVGLVSINLILMTLGILVHIRYLNTLRF